jgi:predicted Fe-Mo cluster-binding NifX family protein
MTPKVLIADQLSPAAVEIFRNRGVDADVRTGLAKDELLKISPSAPPPRSTKTCWRPPGD